MPVNARATTANADACRLNKPNARSFTVQVANQSVYYELNVPQWGNGDSWMPAGGALLTPGFWNFGPDDWAEYGVERAQGIRFRAANVATPGIVSIS